MKEAQGRHEEELPDEGHSHWNVSLWEVIASIPHGQSDDCLSAEMPDVVGLGPTSVLIFLPLLLSFWQHFMGLKTGLFLSHGEALEPPLG